MYFGTHTVKKLSTYHRMRMFFLLIQQLANGLCSETYGSNQHLTDCNVHLSPVP